MSMMINPFKYQTKAVNECIKTLKTKDIFRLQAPTGSGKTFITSLIINDYIFDDELNFDKNTTFIFLAPSIGKLEKQGQEKIQNYLDKCIVSGYRTEYIGTSETKKSYSLNIESFQRNVVYFIGWQMLDKNTNLTNLENEKQNIYSVINKTKSNNTKIVVIIDEAHRDQKYKDSELKTRQEILKELDPYKRIELSATFDEKPDFKITYDEVKNECAIKQNVVISGYNENVENLEEMDSETQLIVSAIEKQKEIKKDYFDNNINNINPLILIQIPDDMKFEDVNNDSPLINKIEYILKKQNINYAIWLDKKKTISNKNEIIKNDSIYDALIFKTAIATGWDIPRANILVKIRNVKKNTFNIQTLGRILRNPHLKYFNIPNIDNAFVYTKDTDYINKIQKESIILDSNKIKSIQRSQKSKNSEFFIDIVKIQIEEKFNETELVNNVINILINNKIFINEFLKFTGQFEYNNTYTTDITNILSNSEKITKEINDFIYNDMQLDTQKSKHIVKITLFDLYVKYKTITKSSKIINSILEEIPKLLSKNKIIKIKDFYKATIQNWKNFYTFDENNEYQLEQYIKFLIDVELKNKTKYKTQTYTLPEEYLINKSKIYDQWDEVNTFDFTINLDNLDSEYEKQCYQIIKEEINKNDKVHVFRNGSSLVKDYYIEYIDNQQEIKKFFPDFIIINEETKTYSIIECKELNDNNNIDKNSKLKFKSFRTYYENNLISSNYMFNKVYRVGLDSNKKLVAKDEINLNTNLEQFTNVIKTLK